MIQERKAVIVELAKTTGQSIWWEHAMTPLKLIMPYAHDDVHKWAVSGAVSALSAVMSPASISGAFRWICQFVRSFFSGCWHWKELFSILLLPPSYANLRACLWVCVANGTKADCLFVIAVGVGLSHLPLSLKAYLFTLFSSVSFRLGLGERCYNLYNMGEVMTVNVQGRRGLQKIVIWNNILRKQSSTSAVNLFEFNCSLCLSIAGMFP